MTLAEVLDRAALWPRLVLLAGVVTALRLAVLALTPTDLFFDEAQYWAWGQAPDLGYYSKPPLIGWLIGAVTGLAGSDAPFWVRAPAPVLHGITAVVLGLWVAEMHRPAALWAAGVYLAMPILAIGSWMISTDTVMAPLLAGALWAWWRHLATGAARWAVVAGLLAGAAAMAKYAGAYVWIGVAVAALWPDLRPRPRMAALAFGAFLLPLLPNVVWNALNGAVTLAHTADNADWASGGGLNWAGLIEFSLAQALVIGPVFFVVWLAALGRPDRDERFLLAFSVPVVALVCVQALISQAYANWAFAAYLAAAPLVALRLMRAGWAGNGVVLAAGFGANAVLVAFVTALIVAPGLSPEATERYMGREALADAVLAEAGGVPVAAGQRRLLADLTYVATRDGGGGRVVSDQPEGAPVRHWYDMVAPRPPGEALMWLGEGAPACAGAPVAEFAPEAGAYEGRRLGLHPLPVGCIVDP